MFTLNIGIPPETYCGTICSQVCAFFASKHLITDKAFQTQTDHKIIVTTTERKSSLFYTLFLR